MQPKQVLGVDEIDLSDLECRGSSIDTDDPRHRYLRRLVSSFIHGIKHMPCEFTPALAAP